MAESARSTTSTRKTVSGWEPGTRVEVRDRFVHGWAHGFIVESAEQDRPPRYRLRRVSDNSVLPALFPEEDLRLA
jgi:hypothetical protein